MHKPEPLTVIADRFELERVAGAGGMGDVYRARDRQDGVRVALKLLRSSSGPLAARFEQEARLLAELRHPAIARHVAHGVSDQGQRYLAMEWLEGEDLASRLARGPLGVEEALALVHRVAEALALVHARGVVHRDLKPGNLFLQGGRLEGVKILDFGIALDRCATGGWTEPGVPLGTPAYMAPEQVRGELDIDARADVYALGCILYECLTGQPPFWAEHTFAVLVKVLFEEAPPPSALRPEVPEAIDQLTARLMAKAREDRPEDAAAVASALAERSPGHAGGGRLAPALTRRERGLVSVVLARVKAPVLSAMFPAPWPDAVTIEAQENVTMSSGASALLLDLRSVAAEHGARLEPLQDGGVAAVVTGAATPTDLAVRAARCGLALRELLPGARVAVATGWDELDGGQPVGPVIDRASALLVGGGAGSASGGAAPASSSAAPASSGAAPSSSGAAPASSGGAASASGGSAPASSSAAPASGGAAPASSGAAPASGGAGPGSGGAGATESPAPVLVDTITASLLGSRFEIAHGPGAAAVVAGEREPVDETRTLLGKPTPFVGRDRELRALLDLFDECAREPCARAGLVIAAPGMGKSRLRVELMRRLRGRPRPPEIWIAQADPARAGAPFDLLGQVVRRAARLVDGEPAARRRERLAARVSRHVEPALRERVTEFLGEMVGAPFPDEERVQLRAARKDPLLMGDQIRRAWVDFVGAECCAGPVLLVLEDLHWGDLPTVQCVGAALRLLGELPLMVLALARPELRTIFPALWVERGTVELGLGELSRRACEQMVRAALGERVSAEHVAEIVRRAGGNPFCVEELVRASAEGRDAREAPETVLAMVQARFKDLDAEERRLLRAGSVLGEVFWKGAAARLLGLEQDGGAALDARIAELLRREWIVRQPEARFAGETELSFRHGLVREAAYGMLTEVDRRLGHRLAGVWLEEAGEHDALVLAEHFERGEAIEAAARWYVRAAEQALEASDLEGALARVERALACASGEDAAIRLHTIAATAHNWRGAFVEAERAAKAAVALSSERGRTAHAAVGMLAWASGALGKADQLEEVASSLPRDVKGAALDWDLLIAWHCACVWLRELTLHAAAEALERVMDDVRPEEIDPLLAGHIYATRASTAVYDKPRRLELAMRLCGLAVQIYERAGSLRHECVTRLALAIVLRRLGAHALAEAAFGEATRAAVQVGLLFIGTGSNLHLAHLRVAQGQSAAARALAERGIEEARALANAWMTGQMRLLLARALLDLGETAEACAQATAAMGELQVYPALLASAKAVLARALLRDGRAAEALAAAREGITIVERLGGIDDDEALVRLAWVEALHASGDVGAARAALAAARDLLRAEADTIESPELRRGFLETVPENARILELAGAWCLAER